MPANVTGAMAVLNYLHHGHQKTDRYLYSQKIYLRYVCSINFQNLFKDMAQLYADRTKVSSVHEEQSH